MGDEYTQIGRDEVKYGETDTETPAAANHYEGFTPLDFEQVNIAGDGLAAVDIFYDRNVHTVTWDINGAYTTQTCRYDAAIAAPRAERTGYAFQGWNAAPEKTMPDRDLGYTAQWTARSFTVKFDSRGGGRVEGISVTYDGIYPALAEPTRTGYTFAGWFGGSTQIREGDIVAVIADTTLAARWKANRYAVNFALNGGAGTTPGGITVTYDGTYSKLPENTAVKTGHSFDGWYTAENGGAKVGPSTTVKTAGDRTLYARWKLNAYTITLDENGGSALSDITADYGATVTLPGPEKKGHTFAGWKLNETTTYQAGTQITMPEDGLTLTAQWSVNQYTVTFDSAGGHRRRACQGGLRADRPGPGSSGEKRLYLCRLANGR
ncbi:InlB B-repeat-containing protein [Lawsonibacter faecis]|uniref:InlB B-repeat-containing protein n=1 Tax=Lawsonibacter faecis TaxID=2763052 RepID=UPI00311AAB6B